MKKLKKKKKDDKSRDIRSFFAATSNVVAKSEVKPEEIRKEREKTKKQTQVAIQVALAKHNPFRRMPPLSPLYNER